MPTNSEKFPTNISTARIFFCPFVPDCSHSSWSQLSSSESNYKQRCLSEEFSMDALPKVKSQRHLHTCVGTRFSDRMHFQPEAQLSHFHLKKITCIALKLHLLPSGNKILNFASVEVSYMLLQKQRKLPWDFIVRKHLETRRIFSIINLPLVHKWCLS